MSFLARSLTTLLLAAALSTGMALLPFAPFGAQTAWPHGGVAEAEVEGAGAAVTAEAMETAMVAVTATAVEHRSAQAAPSALGPRHPQAPVSISVTPARAPGRRAAKARPGPKA